MYTSPISVTQAEWKGPPESQTSRSDRKASRCLRGRRVCVVGGGRVEGRGWGRRVVGGGWEEVGWVEGEAG